MKKEKQVRAYQRRTKSGKMVTVKAHTAKYDAAERAKETAKKKGAGDEISNAKSIKSIEAYLREYPLDKMQDMMSEMLDDGHAATASYKELAKMIHADGKDASYLRKTHNEYAEQFGLSKTKESAEKESAKKRVLLKPKSPIGVTLNGTRYYIGIDGKSVYNMAENKVDAATRKSVLAAYEKSKKERTVSAKVEEKKPAANDVAKAVVRSMVKGAGMRVKDMGDGTYKVMGPRGSKAYSSEDLVATFGSDVQKKKLRSIGSGTNGPRPKGKSEVKVTKTSVSKPATSEPAFTAAEFKEWYRGTGSAADKKVAKALRAQLGRAGYRKLEDEAIDNYSSRGHLSMFKRVSVSVSDTSNSGKSKEHPTVTKPSKSSVKTPTRTVSVKESKAAGKPTTKKFNAEKAMDEIFGSKDMYSAAKKYLGKAAVDRIYKSVELSRPSSSKEHRDRLLSQIEENIGELAWQNSRKK